MSSPNIGPDIDPDGSETAEEATGSQTQTVLRNSALMASGTIVSRITGVARDIAIATALGSFILADTYALGNSLPNIIYILVVGGALNAIFIPQLVRHMKSDADGGDGYADRLITLVGLVLLALSLVTVLLAPWIVRLYATSDFTSADLSLATAFARFCLPQIFFYGVFTMLSQVLNARLKFGAPTFAPIVNNVVMIATAVTFIFLVGTVSRETTLTAGQIALLGIGTTVGVAAQALVLVPVLARAGYRWRPRFDFRGHGLGKAGSLAGWTIGLVLVNQLGFLVISRLATRANVIANDTLGVAQGLATYQRAFLVFMLPHSVITISLVTALLPRMSKAAAEGELAKVSEDVSQGMRLLGGLMLPCVAFLAGFGPMIGTVLFGFGANSGKPATYTGLVVTFFAIGLLPFSLFYMLLRGWYSVENTRTPFFVTVIYNIIAIPLTIALFAMAPDEYKVVSLALSYGAAYWVTMTITWWLLSHRLGGLDSRRTVGALLRMGLGAASAGIIALVAVIGGYALVRGTELTSTYSAITSDQLTSLLMLVVGGLVTLVAFVGAAHLLRIRELTQIMATMRTRLGR